MDIKNEKESIKNLQKQLVALQNEIKAANIPVMILIDGWSGGGKGRMIGKISSQLESRGYTVYSSTAPEPYEYRRPFMWRFWRDIPAKGNLALYEKGWYRNGIEKVKSTNFNKKNKYINSINTFEKQLYDDGYLILKIFLDISKKEQQRRFNNLLSVSETSWRVDKDDLEQNENYDIIKTYREDLIEKTNTEYCPWLIVNNNDKNSGVYEVLNYICNSIELKLKNENLIKTPVKDFSQHLLAMEKLSEINLNTPKPSKDIKKQLKQEREKIRILHSKLYREKIPVIICFEGWDAAGKGGAIRRLSWALDPRGFQTNSISAPTEPEKMRHYLWRFWNRLPKNGHISIFDRTWYGRVLVEKVENFTNEQRVEMAYNEINEFEQELSNWGAVILKFWIHIDKDTQFNRFTLRQITPEKQYKITDEDWRNREKWDEYELAIDEMIEKTSTTYAPWIIVEGNNKEYARLKVIKEVRKALERVLIDKIN